MQESRIETQEDDPLEVVVGMSRQWKPAALEGLPDVFTGGWVGYVGYDTVRYTYPQKIPFESAPADDRDLLDLHLALYKDMAIFDGATKLIYLVSWVSIEDGADVHKLYTTACNRVRLGSSPLHLTGCPSALHHMHVADAPWLHTTCM
jgi:anthranilate synthase component I